jgi:hypothetical protein
MNAMQQEKTNDVAAKALAVEDEMRDIVRREIAATMSKPEPETPAQEQSPPLVPQMKASGATTIEAIERLIAELQETRDYLKTEAERIARASARYAKMSQSASTSVQIISETLQQWKKGTS